MTASSKPIETAICARCGGSIVAGPSFRQCPRCLINLGLLCERESFPPFPSPDFEPLLDSENFDYELLERIGRGGMGVVYRARQRSLNRLVALKMIALGDFATPATLARFQREAETAARLDHPNIVSIIEVGECQTNPYIAMRFVEGSNLADSIKNWALAPRAHGGTLKTHQARIAKLLFTLAQAVDFAHNQGVLHRDLKPSNILLDQDGTPHLTDFGLAKSLDHEVAITQTSELLGTIGYMSPEQASGKPCSRASDIYSLGAILYELLTGHLPFEGPKMLVLKQVQENDPPAPRLINPAIDPDLATICLKCLDKDPARRYHSAAQLANDLDRWLKHEPILAREVGPITRLERWARRNRAVAALLATLSLGITVSLFLLASANEQKNRKSIALDILRTESARQLQEIWSSGNPYFAIKSETLAAMAGMELESLLDVEQRFTIALVAEGNPLDRILNAAALLHEVENSMSKSGQLETRLDLRLYRDQSAAAEALINDEVEFAQLTPQSFIQGLSRNPRLNPILAISIGNDTSHKAVIFSHRQTGITNLAGLQQASFLFGSRDSSLSFGAKVALSRAGLKASSLSKYRFVDEPADRIGTTNNVPAIPLGNPYSSMTPIEAVLAGLYDAGVVREKRFREVAREQGLVELHGFQTSTDLLVAGSNLPEGSIEGLKAALLSAARDKEPDSINLGMIQFKPIEKSELDKISNEMVAAKEFAWE